MVMKTRLKRLWLRSGLRIFYGDPRMVNALYMVRDPWDMELSREAFRFSETNRLIRDQFGTVDRLLELGCGEGHQSVWLRQICNSLYGVDVSSRAIRRSRARCPDGGFAVGDILRDDRNAVLPRVDLVVACEVLYYMKDTEAVLKRISELGTVCFATYYDGCRERLDPFFSRIPDNQKSAFRFGDTRWRAVWWRGPWKDVTAPVATSSRRPRFESFAPMPLIEAPMPLIEVLSVFA